MLTKFETDGHGIIILIIFVLEPKIRKQSQWQSQLQ